jgi:hypothetical protein
VVDQLRGGAPLGAQRLARGMRRVGFDGDEPPVLHHRNAAAVGATQGAIAMDPLCSLVCRHGSPPPERDEWIRTAAYQRVYS